jgi:putative transposase
MLDRQRCGREALPTASIIDSQTFMICKSGGPCGYDAGKKIMCRKRPAIVETNGLALVLVPHLASMQNPEGAGAALQASQRPLPSFVARSSHGGYQ